MYILSHLALNVAGRWILNSGVWQYLFFSLLSIPFNDVAFSPLFPRENGQKIPEKRNRERNMSARDGDWSMQAMCNLDLDLDIIIWSYCPSPHNHFLDEGEDAVFLVPFRLDLFSYYLTANVVVFDSIICGLSCSLFPNLSVLLSFSISPMRWVIAFLPKWLSSSIQYWLAGKWRIIAQAAGDTCGESQMALLQIVLGVSDMITRHVRYGENWTFLDYFYKCSS